MPPIKTIRMVLRTVRSLRCDSRIFRQNQAFTLLEVMIALAIIGLGLTGILSAQAYLYGNNVKARNLTVGVNAARCKMAEIEEKLLKESFPMDDSKGDGDCCSTDSPAGVTCNWTIERVVLPDLPQSSGDAGSSSGGDAGSPFGALGALAGAATNPASAMGDGGIGGLASALAGGGASGSSGMAGMAMTMVYPTLKPLLENSIRRVTVEALWKEGPRSQSVKLVLFVTDPQKGLPPAPMGSGSAPVSPFGTAPSPTSTQRPSSPFSFGGR